MKSPSLPLHHTPTTKYVSSKAASTPASYISWFSFIFFSIWLLFVIKIFVLHSSDTFNQANLNSKASQLVMPSASLENIVQRDYVSRNVLLQESMDQSNGIVPVPSANEWLAIRSGSTKYQPKSSINLISKIETQPIMKLLNNNPIPLAPKQGLETFNGNIKNAYDLVWPPVLPDGNISPSDGYDIMKLTELKVPRFWAAPSGQDLNKIGSVVNGEKTIFLMIASYRDFQCRETIASAFNKADHPERLFVGAVDQVVDGDIGCLDNEVPCSVDPNQPLCKYRNQISVYKMDAQLATGPVTARHIGDRMYRGEYFVMQMDAHCLFVRHWDTSIISQWSQTKNEMAVLSSYLTDIQGSIDGHGDSLRTTRPIMCNSDYEGLMPARYLRHGSQPEEDAPIREMPQLEPFWAAGFSFSRGHFKVRVPYDGYQPMVFQGEEIAIGIRGFTYGYDFYAPRDSVVFHEYAERSSRRKKVHMFWEHSEAHKGEGQKALRRSMAVVRMALDIEEDTYDHTETDKYGLGNVRDVELYYKLFLINRTERKATQLCPFVRPGHMHRDFQKYLRPDGLGIDYSKLVDYDAEKYLKRIN